MTDGESKVAIKNDGPNLPGVNDVTRVRYGLLCLKAPTAVVMPIGVPGIL